MVVRRLACRISSCTTFISAPPDFNQLEKLRRKVCHPIGTEMPALAAAGRTRFRNRLSGQQGCLPALLALAKTQSSGESQGLNVKKCKTKRCLNLGEIFLLQDGSMIEFAPGKKRCKRKLARSPQLSVVYR